jgi:DNA-directed RNA polymerase
MSEEKQKPTIKDVIQKHINGSLGAISISGIFTGSINVQELTEKLELIAAQQIAEKDKEIELLNQQLYAEKSISDLAIEALKSQLAESQKEIGRLLRRINSTYGISDNPED